MSQCFAIQHLETQYLSNFDCFHMVTKYIMTGCNRSTFTNCISLFFPMSNYQLKICDFTSTLFLLKNKPLSCFHVFLFLQLCNFFLLILIPFLCSFSSPFFVALHFSRFASSLFHPSKVLMQGKLIAVAYTLRTY